MKNVGKTIKVFMMIFAGACVVAFIIYFNTVIVADMNQEISVPAYPVVDQPRILREEPEKVPLEGARRGDEAQEPARFEDAVPAVPHKELSNDPILVN